MNDENPPPIITMRWRVWNGEPAIADIRDTTAARLLTAFKKLLDSLPSEIADKLEDLRRYAEAFKYVTTPIALPSLVDFVHFHELDTHSAYWAWLCIGVLLEGAEQPVEKMSPRIATAAVKSMCRYPLLREYVKHVVGMCPRIAAADKGRMLEWNSN